MGCCPSPVDPRAGARLGSGQMCGHGVGKTPSSAREGTGDPQSGATDEVDDQDDQQNDHEDSDDLHATTLSSRMRV
jgi:hypothetical protein